MPLCSMFRRGRKYSPFLLCSLLNPTHNLANMDSSKPGALTPDACSGQKVRAGTNEARVTQDEQIQNPYC